MLYFARAREATGGMTEESFEVGGAADTDTLRAALVAKHPSLESVLESCVLAVNQEYATENTALGEGCEVAIIPPISGGEGESHDGSRRWRTKMTRGLAWRNGRRRGQHI